MKFMSTRHFATLASLWHCTLPKPLIANASLRHKDHYILTANIESLFQCVILPKTRHLAQKRHMANASLDQKSKLDQNVTWSKKCGTREYISWIEWRYFGDVIFFRSDVFGSRNGVTLVAKWCFSEVRCWIDAYPPGQANTNIMTKRDDSLTFLSYAF